MSLLKKGIIPALVACASLMSTAARAETVQVSPYSPEFTLVVNGGETRYVPLMPDGAPAAASVLSNEGSRGGAAIADFDGDGDTDVLVAATNGVRLYTNDGQGNFTRGNHGNPVIYHGSGYIVSMAVGDFTSDGHLDVIVQDSSGNYHGIYLYRGNGAGGFSARTRIAPLSGYEAVDAYDVNHDGHLDLLIHDWGDYADYLGSAVYWREGTGQGTFSAVRPLTGDGETDAQALQQQLDQALANLGIADEENAALEQNLEACEALADSLWSELEGALATIDALNATVNTLQGELATANQTIATLEDTVTGLEAELDAARQTIAAQAATITALQNEVASLNAEKAQLQSQVESLQAELDLANGTLDRTLAQVEADFGDPGFAIPGATRLERQQHLADAITRLNKGRKMGLYQDPGRAAGSGR